MVTLERRERGGEGESNICLGVERAKDYGSSERLGLGWNAVEFILLGLGSIILG